MPIKKDIWRIGAIRAPLRDVIQAGLSGRAVTWLQEMPALTFLADPFGLWRDGHLYVFAEAYDYRDRHGFIEALTFDAAFTLLDRRTVLKEPWHLSYPFIAEADGEIYMLPEAFRSGGVTLYRARAFPHHWEPVRTITLDHAPIDATPVFHQGLWWMFYTPATTRAAKVSDLHVAYAPRLDGPWTPHPMNPVRRDPSCSRPGGTPLVIDGALVVPMQDCRGTYGGAMRPLKVTVLTPTTFEAAPGDVLKADGEDGFHTLAGAGDITLIDVKRFHVSPASLALDIRHVLRKAFR